VGGRVGERQHGFAVAHVKRKYLPESPFLPACGHEGCLAASGWDERGNEMGLVGLCLPRRPGNWPAGQPRCC
jgi:hypothetical protein